MTFALSAVVALLLFLPRLIARTCYQLAMLVDAFNRRAVTAHQRRWPYATVPHSRLDVLKEQLPAAERAKWRLVCEEGRQRWMFDNNNNNNKNIKKKPTFVERYSMGLEPESPVRPRAAPEAALMDGAAFLTKLQDDTDGHWPNDYSGPLFLTCGPVFAKYIIFGGDIDKTWQPHERAELIRYLVNIQNDDGGFGMHTEGESTMFGTVLNFVVLRLLGCACGTNKKNADAGSAAATRAAAWIKEHGGAQTVPSWGKAWLACLGLYDWRGLNAVSAELWLLPDWSPISLGKVWCHSRVVTLAFSWLYSKRWVCDDTPLLRQVRGELYSVTPYERIDWAACRNNVRGADLYTPVSGLYHVVNSMLLLYEHHLPSCVKFLRERALAKCYDHMRFDDTSTNYICLGPVNKALNMLCTWIAEGPASPRLAQHLERIPDYFWEGVDGMRMSGYNGSQLWDTSFALQALFAAPDSTGVVDRFAAEIARGHHYIDIAQVRDDPEGFRSYYRSRAKGAWNFSTRAQSWQVSDCTAEGLRIALLARAHPKISRRSDIALLEDQRLFDAVDTILALRDVDGPDGAWASYEEPRGGVYYELLNCAEVYKDIMVDYTYAECTSSCVHTLILFRRQFPAYRRTNVDRAIAAGVAAIRGKQRADGSWYGSWAVCFTYAAWLATEALKLAAEDGEAGDSTQTFAKSNAFLLSKQRADGGWGEDFNACVTQQWVENPDGSQVVNTAWAVMALIAAGAGPAQYDAIERGARFIMSRQLASGDCKQERISGVFNGNCAIHYPAYKNNMTVWALAKFVELKKKSLNK